MHFLIFFQVLVRVQNRAETVLDTQNVVVDRVQVRCWVRARDIGVVQTVDTVCQGRRHNDTERVQTAKVQRACWLKLGRVQAVRNDGHVGRAVVVHVAEGCVVVLGNITEVNQGPRVADIHAVDLGLELVVGGVQRAVAVGVNLTVVDTREGQELDRLSQGQLLDGVGAEHNTLHLGDE